MIRADDKISWSNLTAHDRQVWFGRVKDETKGALIFALRSLSLHQHSCNAGRWPKKQPCRPCNTCYTQWSNLSKVTRKTGLSHTRGHVASKSLSLNRRGRSERVPRLKIHRARKPVSSCVRGRRKYQVPPHAPFLSWQSFFFLLLPLMMFLVTLFDESISITVESRCEGRREKMKAASTLKLPEETCCLYYGHGNRKADYARKSMCIRKIYVYSMVLSQYV